MDGPQRPPWMVVAVGWSRQSAVSPLPKSWVCKGSDQEGGGHGLRSGLNLGEWRGNGCGLGEQGGW